jgi:integrase
VNSIRREHVNAIHLQIGETRGRYAANRVLQFLRAVINWSIEEKLFHGENPAAGIKQFHEASRDRFLQGDEMPKLFATLRDEPNRNLADYVWLALMTGARRGDILAMRWEQVNLEAGIWTIPNPKSREVYAAVLMPQAIEVLRNRRETCPGDWVFPSDSKPGHVIDLKHPWGRFRKRAGLPDLRLHDLRRSLGSWCAANNVSMTIVAKVLGHKSLAATKVYSRLNLDAARSAVETATSAMLKASERKLLPAPGAGAA